MAGWELAAAVFKVVQQPSGAGQLFAWHFVDGLKVVDHEPLFATAEELEAAYQEACSAQIRAGLASLNSGDVAHLIAEPPDSSELKGFYRAK